MDSFSIKELDIDKVIPYENNPRNNDNAVEAVARSLKAFGFRQPIVIDRNKVVIVGHTRLRAAKLLGLEKVPVHIADRLSKEQADAYRLADNKTGEISDWDYNTLALELYNIENVDMTELGFIDEIDINDFDDDFELPDGDKPDLGYIVLTLHKKQLDQLEAALDLIDNVQVETYGNPHEKGNKLFQVVKQWAEVQKK